jgi:hypothetical protein
MEELLVSRSTAPRSVESWQTLSVPAGSRATYPMPIGTDDGRVFVFFRDTTTAVVDVRPMRYAVSDDNGLTWTASEVVLGSDDRPDNVTEIYIGQTRYERGVFPIAWTLAGGGPEGNKHDRYHRDVYYASFDPRTARFDRRDSVSRRRAGTVAFGARREPAAADALAVDLARPAVTDEVVHRVAVDGDLAVAVGALGVPEDLGVDARGVDLAGRLDQQRQPDRGAFAVAARPRRPRRVPVEPIEGTAGGVGQVGADRAGRGGVEVEDAAAGRRLGWGHPPTGRAAIDLDPLLDFGDGRLGTGLRSER